MAYPQAIVGVYADQPVPRSINQAKKFIMKRRLAFTNEDGKLICAVDRFSLEVDRICEWLCERIDDPSIDEANITQLHKWLQIDSDELRDSLGDEDAVE